MRSNLKERWHRVIFGAETPAGKNFDVVLIIAILISMLAVVLESIPALNADYGYYFRVVEWIVTVLFTIEYIARIIVARKPLGYIFSFFGIIDFLAVIPTYLGLLFAGAGSLLIIRALRLLRIFRVFKLSRYTSEGEIIIDALKASKVKIGVFLFGVLTVILIIGTIMYLIEGAENGFTSIPRSMYWTVVTITTVGYGDISPQTPVGQFIAGMAMLIGYAIIAVPTGIVTVEFTRAKDRKKQAPETCPSCSSGGHDSDARFCRICGARLKK
ncbi:MAG: ion transporter [Bacteroidales bacterium]